MKNVKKIQISSDEDDLIKNIRLMNRKFNVVSLFSGAGGLDLGLELAGLDVNKGSISVDEALKERNSFEDIRKDSIF